MKLITVAKNSLGIGSVIALLSACGSPYNSSYNSPSQAPVFNDLEESSLPRSRSPMPAVQDFGSSDSSRAEETKTEPKQAAPLTPADSKAEPSSQPETVPVAETPSVPRPSAAPISEPAPFTFEKPQITITSSLRLLRMPEFRGSWGLRRDMYEKVANYYNSNRQYLKNSNYVTIVDFSKRSTEKRFFIFDLRQGKVIRLLTTHGRNSDPKNTGLATLFANEEDSLKSSLGFFLTLDSYEGENGYSLRLQGIEASNSNAEKRGIVIHSAPYVNEDLGRAGRSWGCLALDPKISRSVINHLRNGSLLYIGR